MPASVCFHDQKQVHRLIGAHAASSADPQAVSELKLMDLRRLSIVSLTATRHAWSDALEESSLLRSQHVQGLGMLV